MTEKQEVAKNMYVKGANAEDIAKSIDVHPSTVYKWIKDKNLDFEDAKELANLSIDAMGELLLEAHKKSLLEIKKNPSQLLQAGTADGLLKVIKAIKSLKKDVDYLGVSADVVKKATEIIKEEHLDFLEAWKVVAEKLLERLEEEYS